MLVYSGVDDVMSHENGHDDEVVTQHLMIGTVLQKLRINTYNVMEHASS